MTSGNEPRFEATIFLNVAYEKDWNGTISFRRLGTLPNALFMSENVTSTPRTRHMDARYWWITDLQESGLIKVSFVPTKDNLSDIGTKNVTGDVFDRIRPELMVERPQSD